MSSLRARIAFALGLLAAVAAAGWASWLIFGKSPPHASLEAAACREKPRELNNLQAATTVGGLPEVALAGGDGEVAFARYAGRGIVLNFWATWCAPCIKELPSLARLAATADETLAVLPVSEDREGPAVVARFLGVNKLDALPVLVDPKGALARAYGVEGLPTTVLIDRGGREVGRVVGIAEWDGAEVRAFLETCLGAAQPARGEKEPRAARMRYTDLAAAKDGRE